MVIELLKQQEAYHSLGMTRLSWLPSSGPEILA